MSYQVIARKYRPQRFEDVVGQEHVTTTLANAIRANRIAHGYIFCGPRGTGKTTLARIFAKALNCTGGPKADFDLADPRVQEIAEGRSLDVLEIDGASNNGVEQVRELRDTARFAPAGGRFKIYIIDEVHMLSTAAFNALLKTLEEPPAHVKFLFATTDPEKVLITILSRCQRFDLRRIPSALIVKHLAWIAAQEKVAIDDAALHAIARGADGGMRDAESTLDQLISFCGGRIEESDVLSMFGLAARGQVLELSRAIVSAQPEQTLRLVDALARSGKDLGRLLGDLLNHFRNLLLFQISKGDKSILETSEAEYELLSTQSREIDSDALTRILESLSRSESQFRDAGSKRIFLEITLLKAIQARDSLSLDAVLKQLQLLRSADPGPRPAVVPPPAPTVLPAVGAAPGAVPAPVALPPSTPSLPAATPAPVPPPAAAQKVPEVSSSAPVRVAPTEPSTPLPPATVGEVWTAFLASLGNDPIIRSQLADGTAVSFVNGLLTVALPEDHLDLLNSPARLTSFRTRLQQLGISRGDIQFVAQPKPEVPPPASRPSAPTVAAAKPTPAPRPMEAKPAAKPQPVRLNKDEFLNDPLIKAALEVFRATLIEVRAPGSTSEAAGSTL
jgi:DNA polymerase-3 subunit gamma/tau